MTASSQSSSASTASAHDGKLPVIISVYGIGWDENYADVEKREPIFSGTAYEYIEKFGKEQ